jgi:hypothetical protein
MQVTMQDPNPSQRGRHQRIPRQHKMKCMATAWTCGFILSVVGNHRESPGLRGLSPLETFVPRAPALLTASKATSDTVVKVQEESHLALT